VLFFQSAFGQSKKSKSWILMFAKFNTEKKIWVLSMELKKSKKDRKHCFFRKKRGLSLLFEMN